MLSRELDNYDALHLQNQATAATLNFDNREYNLGASHIMSSTNLPKKLKNIDRDYEVSSNRPLVKQFSTEYLDKFGSYSPKGGSRRPDRPMSGALKNAGHN
jgi:hypothetical protein